MILFTGGKTGGHIIPLINIIKASHLDSIYVGYKGYLEEKICKTNMIEFIGIDVHKNKYKTILKGYKYLKRKLKYLNIKAVVSTGGFVSTPAVLYAIKNKIPIYLIEENLILGSFNKVFYPFCKKTYLAYDLNKMKRKYETIGLPLLIDNSRYKIEYDILIIGGSLGSRKLCDLALILAEKYKVLLIAGRYKNEYKNDSYTTLEYSNDLHTLIKKSRIIISRAGAMTLGEIMYIKKPLICIPSKSTKGNHQFYNAKYFQDKNALIMLDEDSAKNKILKAVDSIDDIKYADMINNQNKLMKKDSIKIITEELMRINEL